MLQAKLDDPGFDNNPWLAFEQDAQALEPMPREFASEDRSNEGERAGAPVDDYSEEQAWVYARLRQHVRAAVNLNSSRRMRSKAIEWIFVRNTVDDGGLDFRTACQALSARPLVVQSRTMYQFFLAGICFCEPLPILADGLPECLAAEALVHAGDDGMAVARFSWRWPGVRADLLRQRFAHLPQRRWQSAIERLEDSGLMAVRYGHWYFITRNPPDLAAQGRRAFSWARSILGDA